ncbi:hypothetical protein KZZ52_38975 [Dactylosporangium sp. AC04546]|uniref:hypothetical protein n=1 Tax=Dactylosporangium sp. AC04546 TaxID=2862460 RepID=UPI001EDDBBC1|nr:hypothetical protein [Dactylosporangium sp. AC04546]WVK79935.1 hypothetical protein KZZ52_38975 [Dactylosporangium sp. AC04546]
MSADPAALLTVLADTRALLARPGNDFTWSSFGDTASALAELDAFTAAVRAGAPAPTGLRVLYAPTGPIQEVSLSSGWGDEFLDLATRFDAATG